RTPTNPPTKPHGGLPSCPTIGATARDRDDVPACTRLIVFSRHFRFDGRSSVASYTTQTAFGSDSSRDLASKHGPFHGADDRRRARICVGAKRQVVVYGPLLH